MSLDRLPLFRLALGVALLIGIVVTVETLDGPDRHYPDVGAVVASWFTGMAELVLAGLLVAALIRHERRERRRPSG